MERFGPPPSGQSTGGSGPPWSYALFRTATDGFRLHRSLRVQGLPHALCPTPRHLAASCGLALRFASDLEGEVRRSADALSVPVDLVCEERPLREGPCGGLGASGDERT